MVINHLEKLFVTSDASTIINELEVNHPAAKLIAMAAKAQEAEIGDGTNLVSRIRLTPASSACLRIKQPPMDRLITQLSALFAPQLRC
jgi:hypothetical protein